jgi:hypothetical protein
MITKEIIIIFQNILDFAIKCSGPAKETKIKTGGRARRRRLHLRPAAGY